MNEKDVREIFAKHYSGGVSAEGGLNEAVMAASEEIFFNLAEKHAGTETVSDILKTIARGKSLIDLFTGVAAGVQTFSAVPMHYINYFDELRKLVIDAVDYAHDNYDTMNSWFRGRFLPEHLKDISSEIAKALENSPDLPANSRGLRRDELKIESELFTNVLIGILGTERFQSYAEEYNDCMKILRRCQAECKILETTPPSGKPS